MLFNQTFVLIWLNVKPHVKEEEKQSLPVEWKTGIQEKKSY